MDWVHFQKMIFHFNFFYFFGSRSIEISIFLSTVYGVKPKLSFLSISFLSFSSNRSTALSIISILQPIYHRLFQKSNPISNNPSIRYDPFLFSILKKNRCPIMIGGGKEAQTLLGIASDVETGEDMFLILDPHYKGYKRVFWETIDCFSFFRDEEISSVMKGGWCGWKRKNEVFKLKNFYNLCLPIVGHFLLRID